MGTSVQLSKLVKETMEDDAVVIVGLCGWWACDRIPTQGEPEQWPRRQDLRRETKTWKQHNQRLRSSVHHTTASFYWSKPHNYLERVNIRKNTQLIDDRNICFPAYLHVLPE